MKEDRTVTQLRAENRRSDSASFPAITGASSLLVIFSVLCLAVFALLALSTVQANHRLSLKDEAAVKGYYQAEAEANRILAQLRQGTVPGGVTEAAADDKATGETVYTYRCAISDTQELAVRVAVNAQTGAYRVLEWQARATGAWTPSDTLPVYQK